MTTRLWTWKQLNEVMTNAVKFGFTKTRLTNGHYVLKDSAGNEVLKAMKGTRDYSVVHQFININISI